jgi:thiamine-monophosphate kinase
MAENQQDEFSLIEKYLRPLTRGNEAARQLLDDVAVVGDLIITSDMLIAGVHFLPEDDLALVARKALRVNISDLTAKGAKAFGYFLSIAWPQKTGETDMARFVEGLRLDGEYYDLALLGGDTTRHRKGDAPLTISVTMLGHAGGARVPSRSGAEAGDYLYVTGVIGDAGLGLKVLQGQLSLDEQGQLALIGNYYLPSPPVALAPSITNLAKASLDISDGLIADAAHMAKASHLDINFHADKMPFSLAAKLWLSEQPDRQAALMALLCAGDDYQTLLAIAPKDALEIEALAQKAKIKLTRIGEAEKPKTNPVIRLWSDKGQEIPVSQSGYQHF